MFIKILLLIPLIFILFSCGNNKEGLTKKLQTKIIRTLPINKRNYEKWDGEIEPLNSSDSVKQSKARIIIKLKK
ncbi:MAG: hypothetical protein FE834_05985 [Gammaproteobacteria bacterium]|nr:hypothetical protein [Gammaproteobacteria bacterium]